MYILVLHLLLARFVILSNWSLLRSSARSSQHSIHIVVKFTKSFSGRPHWSHLELFYAYLSSLLFRHLFLRFVLWRTITEIIIHLGIVPILPWFILFIHSVDQKHIVQEHLSHFLVSFGFLSVNLCQIWRTFLRK